MKVYELISELSKLPAGSEVEFSTLMTLKEFVNLPIMDSFDGEDAYRFSATVREVEPISDKTVALYM